MVLTATSTIILLRIWDTSTQKLNEENQYTENQIICQSLYAVSKKMADILILKSRFPSGACWPYFLHSACQASLKYSKLSSKFINCAAVRESGGVGGESRSRGSSRLIKKKKEQTHILWEHGLSGGKEPVRLPDHLLQKYED